VDPTGTQQLEHQRELPHQPGDADALPRNVFTLPQAGNAEAEEAGHRLLPVEAALVDFAQIE
jgi:hypothetical protein